MLKHLLPTNKQSPLTTPSTPEIISLELTSLCNNFCSGCANSMLRGGKVSRKGMEYMHMRNWDYVLERVAEAKPRLIRLTGGEPTLHPEFDLIIKTIDALSIPFALFSDGRWVKPEQVLKSLKGASNLVGVLISLHGKDAAQHNAFVESVPTAFEETCETIRNAHDAGLKVFTNTVITALNYSSIPKLVEKALSVGSNYMVFNRFLGAPDHPLMPTPVQLREAFEDIETMREQGFPCRVGTAIPPCFSQVHIEPERAGYEHISITPRGTIRPDNFEDSPRYPNLRAGSWKYLMEHSSVATFRSRASKGCDTCAAWSLCRGGNKSLIDFLFFFFSYFFFLLLLLLIIIILFFFIFFFFFIIMFMFLFFYLFSFSTSHHFIFLYHLPILIDEN